MYNDGPRAERVKNKSYVCNHYTYENVLHNVNIIVYRDDYDICPTSMQRWA